MIGGLFFCLFFVFFLRCHFYWAAEGRSFICAFLFVSILEVKLIVQTTDTARAIEPGVFHLGVTDRVLKP